MDGIRISRSMTLEELRDAEAYLHQTRDLIVENIGTTPPEELDDKKRRIRYADLHLMRIKSMIKHREEEFELRINLPDNVTTVQFDRPTRRKESDR